MASLIERFAMKILRNCPKCGGTVLTDLDGLVCANCGFRRAVIPADVQEEVFEHLGRPYVERRKQPIGRGKPPISGWEREKLRRAECGST